MLRMYIMNKHRPGWIFFLNQLRLKNRSRSHRSIALPAPPKLCVTPAPQHLLESVLRKRIKVIVGLLWQVFSFNPWNHCNHSVAESHHFNAAPAPVRMIDLVPIIWLIWYKISGAAAALSRKIIRFEELTVKIPVKSGLVYGTFRKCSL
jgi:hypothetical protein